MMLIYPMTANFHASLPVFDYSDTLELWAVPFNLETGELVQRTGFVRDWFLPDLLVGVA